MKKLLERKVLFIYHYPCSFCGCLLLLVLFPSLFPSTEKPAVKAWLRYTRLSSVDFKAQYGDEIESKLSQIDNVVEVTGDYFTNGVRYTALFEWETDSEDAKDEVQRVLNVVESRFPRSWRKFWIWNASGSSGTYVGGIYSKKTIMELSGSLIKV